MTETTETPSNEAPDNAGVQETTPSVPDTSPKLQALIDREHKVRESEKELKELEQLRAFKNSALTNPEAFLRSAGVDVSALQPPQPPDEQAQLRQTVSELQRKLQAQEHSAQQAREQAEMDAIHEELSTWAKDQTDHPILQVPRAADYFAQRMVQEYRSTGKLPSNREVAESTVAELVEIATAFAPFAKGQEEAKPEPKANPTFGLSDAMATPEQRSSENYEEYDLMDKDSFISRLIADHT